VKVSKAKQSKRMSKGADFPWVVWHICEGNDQHSEYSAHKTKSRAERCVRQNLGLVAPVIAHTGIPPMEY